MFLLEKVKQYSDDDWTYFSYNIDQSLGQREREEPGILNRLKQNLLSIVEIFRVLELNNAVFNENKTMLDFIVQKGELRINLDSLTSLYELGKPFYE